MRVILVPVANRPESKTALDVSIWLAKKLRADVVGFHLRAHRHPDDDTLRQQLIRSQSLALSKLALKDSHAAAAAAEKLFTKKINANGFVLSKHARLGVENGAQWHELVGSPDKVMAILGPLSDLTVVTRPTAKGHVAKAFLMSALLCSRRPVLVLPPSQSHVPGRRVAIAWNQSIEASRVVVDSLPILQQAEAVTIIVSGSETQLGPKSSYLREYLTRYGIKADKIRTRGREEAQELLGAYRETKSDVLIMGAYSRSRFREIVFGGVTEQMLWHTNIPVILQHD
jgi:nucleotide-binding universal stress UspA family protein